MANQVIDKLAEDIEAARRVSTPLIAVRTSDISDTLSRLLPGLKTVGDEPVPLTSWDCVRGLKGLDESDVTKAALAAIASRFSGRLEATVNPVAMLDAALSVAPKNTVIVMYNAHLVMDANLKQALWNLRDAFKRNGRSVMLFGRVMNIPAELEGDVSVYNEPLPDRARAAKLIKQTFKDAEVAQPNDSVLERAVDAVRGLSPFAIDQNAALSMTDQSIDVATLRDRRCAVVEQTPGLSVSTSAAKFDDIGGNENAKGFFRRVLKGEMAPTVVVFIDEIEKAMGGASGDTSGTSQDQLQQFLTFMQDKRATGNIFVGHPGCSKSAFAKAIGNEGDILTVQFDMGAMKGSLVGQSEQRIREAFRVIDAISDGRALFIATCNRLAGLPPELRRRFKFGTFFFDLPDQSERDVIWKIYLKKFGLKASDPRPNDVGWTGAEIEQCCELAWRLKSPLREASAYIVPVSTASPEKIKALCEEANGRYISASKPGFYQFEEREERLLEANIESTSTGRRIARRS